MNEIITILETLSSTLSKKTLNQLIVIVEATLAMTGRVTMLGISRWTGKGGSYALCNASLMKIIRGQNGVGY